MVRAQDFERVNSSAAVAFRRAGLLFLEFSLHFTIKRVRLCIKMSHYDPAARLPEGSLSNCAPAAWLHETLNMNLCALVELERTAQNFSLCAEIVLIEL